MSKLLLIILTLSLFITLTMALNLQQDGTEPSALSEQDAPVATTWVDQWESSFTEAVYFPIFGTDHITGNWSYDFTNRLFAISRSNGKLDRYCGTIYKGRKTPCTQIIREGKRYVIFPEKKFCCMCCTAASGCGIIKPDWFTSGSFNGEKTVDGTNTNEYIVKGLQSNYYNESKDAQTPARIFQDPLSDMVFSVENYSVGIKDSSVFDLPTEYGSCERSCGTFSVCRWV
jgi:hypothetical protein